MKQRVRTFDRLALEVSGMLDIRPAAPADAEAVSLIIRQSFVTQAQLLELTPANCPTYVAFETALGVQRRIERGARGSGFSRRSTRRNGQLPPP